LSGRPVALDLRSLEHKLVQSRRGGYCFEQNLLFKHVLNASASTSQRSPRASFGSGRLDEVRARSHMVLLVALGERRYFCDVGFGGLTPTAPIELAVDIEQPTPHETFRVVRVANELAVRLACAKRGSGSIASTYKSSTKSTSRS
jgi:N-hydroxyarylamine O-acetyltransferase